MITDARLKLTVQRYDLSGIGPRPILLNFAAAVLKKDQPPISMTVLMICALLLAGIFFFLRLPRFGATPSGARLARMERSPHYHDGQFHNLHHTPALTEGTSYYQVLKKFFFEKKERRKPSRPLPSVKTDLLHLNPTEDLLVWFGHSSYFLQLNGLRFLVDPVLSGAASPVSFTTRSFPGTDTYTVDDLPPIDYLLLSHDHYDHMDHDTVSALRSKTGRVITGLGVGAHLERWGYRQDQIVELDWNETLTLEKGLVLHTAPARHFSGRKFRRNNTLWLSFVLVAPGRKLYLGADSGYDTHFRAIGEQFGPFDLAILENGQYDPSWRYIHMMPEEMIQAAQDLRARQVLPVHWGKFALGNHSWDEPITRALREAQQKNVNLLHPMIGEKLVLDGHTPPQKNWWKGY